MKRNEKRNLEHYGKTYSIEYIKLHGVDVEPLERMAELPRVIISFN